MNTDFPAMNHIPGDKVPDWPRIHALHELVLIKLEPFCYFQDLRIVERAKIFKQLSAKFPEFPLGVCGHGCLGCLAREPVAGKGKIYCNQLDLVRILIQHLLDKALYARTIGSLVIIKNGDGHRGIRRPFERMAGDVNGENSLHFDRRSMVLCVTYWFWV